MRAMYCTFFYGPFQDEASLIEAIKKLDDSDPYWDYDLFCIHYGKSPLPSDYINGFNFVDNDMRNRIEAARNYVA